MIDIKTLIGAAILSVAVLIVIQGFRVTTHHSEDKKTGKGSSSATTNGNSVEKR